MQLLSLSVKNIWPFVGEKSFDYRKGKYLISAPIGSGKSFLFFDAPLYGLYKYSTRNMVNVNATSAHIHIVFSIDEKVYLVERKLKPWKVKDSCETLIYSMDKNYTFDWSLQPFKNEIDQQAFLDSILPPKEVFLSTCFLMQDSENIFDVTPKERLDILRDVFWLWDFEQYKDVLSAKRIKEKTRLEIDTQMKTQMSEKIGQLENKMTGLSLDYMTKGMIFPDGKQSVMSKIDAVKALHTENKLIKDDVVRLDRDIVEFVNKTNDLERHKFAILAKLDALDPKKYEDLLFERFSRENSQRVLYSELHPSLKAVWSSFPDLVLYLSEMNAKMVANTTKINNLEKEKKTITTTFIHEKMQYDLACDPLGDLKKRLEDIEKGNRSERPYICDRGDGDCKGTKLANDNYYESIETKKRDIQRQVDTINNLQKPKNPEFHAIDNDLVFITTELNIQEESRRWYDIDLFKHNNAEYKKHEIRLAQISDAISGFDKIRLAKLTQEFTDCNVQLSSILLQRKHLDSSLEKKNARRTEINELIKQSPDLDGLQKFVEDCDTYTRLHGELVTMQSDFETYRAKRKEQKELVDVCNTLYDLFSRDLLLILLGNTLQSLQDIMNDYLSQVVDYQLKFELVQKETGKVELDISVYDQRWERNVKSLSGWQRVILRLVRMLTVVTYTQSPLLFIDETINNLDQSTVGKVSELLEAFTKKNDLMFYCVTHSEAIQQMSIWDWRIDVQNI